MASSVPLWYVFYTFPRAEKVVNNELQQRNYECFLPLYKTIRIWRNRQRKMIYSPLFPGYVFVRTNEIEIYNILKIPQICTCVKCGNKPSIVPNKEIEGIKALLGLENEIFVEHGFVEGEHVRITRGALLGHQGILLKQKGKYRFGIKLDSIKQVATIDINVSIVEKIAY